LFRTNNKQFSTWAKPSTLVNVNTSSCFGTAMYQSHCAKTMSSLRSWSSTSIFISQCTRPSWLQGQQPR
jgi:hypothetical protein